MPIHFIPNDPLAVSDLPMRTGIRPRRNRRRGRAGFEFRNALPEAEAALGTPEFVFWQCREAVLRTIDVWENLTGALRAWSPRSSDPTTLRVECDLGEQLNAYYDRQSLSFFHKTTDDKTTFSGASTDVVSHECGHALLDAIRPELFDVAQTEFGAFHEAFGDCIAILVALSDADCRSALLERSPNLSAPNFVEALMEDLADGVCRLRGQSHPSAAPRRALNKFRFELPTALPAVGSPDVLTAQEHSFSRLFTGCFYDLIRGIFLGSTERTQESLGLAARSAGILLIAGAREAPLNSRFFQSVGRAMVLADTTANGGKNRPFIGRAFAKHGILLGSSSALMPAISLAGGPPQVSGRRQIAVTAKTSADLKRRLGAPTSARLSFARVTLGGQELVQAIYQRTVPLGKLDPRLRGAVAMVPETAVLRRSGAAAAVMGALSNSETTSEETLAFVKSLIESGRLAMPTRGRRPARAAFSARAADDSWPTHAVVSEHGKRVLRRIRFACGCLSSRSY